MLRNVARGLAIRQDEAPRLRRHPAARRGFMKNEDPNPDRMAIFHLTAKIVSRSKAQSVVAKAAYNARERLTEDATGETKDYTRKGGCVFEGVFAPKNAPEWARERETLWNGVEAREKRKDAQLAREIEIALPHELTDQQREGLVKDFVREAFVRKGMVADVCIHAPDEDGDARNHHAHILLTLREIGPDGFGPKVREWNSGAQLEQWREQWEHLANRHLERHGFEARIDRRTLAEQGLEREPTEHLGPIATAIIRRGMPSNRYEDLREAVAHNDALEKAKRELEEIEQELEKEQKRAAYRDMTAGLIRDAWSQSDGGGLAFVMGMQERGLHLARDEHGRFVAVSENGFTHSLGAKRHPDTAHAMHDALSEMQREHGALMIPTVDECRAGIKQRREDAKREREIEASSGLNPTQAEIRLCYGLTQDGASFASALEDRGLFVARVTEGEAEQSRIIAEAFALDATREHAPPVLTADELVVVNRYGGVYRLTGRTTGDSPAGIEERLAGIYRDELLTLTDAKDASLAWRKEQERGHEWRQVRADNLRHFDAYWTQPYPHPPWPSQKQKRHPLPDDTPRPMHPDDYRETMDAEGTQAGPSQEQAKAYDEDHDRAKSDVARFLEDREFRREVLADSTKARDAEEQAREDKKDRTEQTEERQKREARDEVRRALRDGPTWSQQRGYDDEDEGGGGRTRER